MYNAQTVPDDGNNQAAKEAYEALFIFTLENTYTRNPKEVDFRQEVIQTARDNYGYDIKEKVRKLLFGKNVKCVLAVSNNITLVRCHGMLRLQ